jgi:hypothetical protein
MILCCISQVLHVVLQVRYQDSFFQFHVLYIYSFYIDVNIVHVTFLSHVSHRVLTERNVISDSFCVFAHSVRNSCTISHYNFGTISP